MKTSFTFTWLGNTNLIFRNQKTGEQCEVVLFHDKEDGFIEKGPIADGYFGDGATCPRYYTKIRSSEFDLDTMVLFLSEITKIPVDEIKIKEPSRLP